MSQRYRLPKGGQIDRSEAIRFSFDGREYTGYQGDTLASALLANDVKLLARSFKYHRPRGVMSAGTEEPNALVQLESGAHTLPNVRATEIEIYEGLNANSQNCWPSLQFDVGAINNTLGRFLPAGFYYKTFMWPKFLWMKYEEVIRHSAGLGKSPLAADPNCYDHQHLHCDILIVGAGPAGLAAALAAAETGAEVVLMDENAKWGGSLSDQDGDIQGLPASQWIDQSIASMQDHPQVKCLRRTTVTGYYDHNYLVANQRISNHLGPNAPADIPRERLWKIRAQKVILATGAIERPLVFADNDRPGILLASALQRYITHYGVLPGRKLAILCNNDSAYALAANASRAGAEVVVLDIRETTPAPCLQLSRTHNFELRENTTITGVRYKDGLKAIDVALLTHDGSDIEGNIETLEADLIGVSGGWSPALHLYSQAGGKLAYDENRHCFLPRGDQKLKPDARLVGSCAGDFSLNDCLERGHQAGLQAATDCGFEAGQTSAPTATEQAWLCRDLRPLWILPCDHPIGQGPKKHFHEPHNDSTIADITLAQREGYLSVEHLKRYTTTGMGIDQGKTSNVNALTVMAQLRNKPISEVGTTTFRPPYTTLSFGTIVGQNRRELFLQKRTSPMEPWHQEHGAIYEDVGDWKRPRYFPKAGESMQQAVQRECRAVRSSVGILDATTLGKIDIQGPDAAKLLNMVYTNAWSLLGINRCRYGLMLNEHGMVFDDGVTTRLGDNHFHMTTTTGGAARVMNWLEELLQTEWPEWQVYCTSVTEQWAVMAINGPRARDLLAGLCDADLSIEAFPFMSMIETEVAGIPARIYRISFTGELAFEINVPSRYGLHVWKAVMKAGEDYDLTPYGTEAMHVLRAEKGFIIVGQETDGSATPFDLGMSWIVSKKKKDFIGKRSLARSDTAREGRKQLVGLFTEDPHFVLPEGAHLVSEVKPAPPMAMIGHVTSSYMSPAVGRSIAMAMLVDGANRIGEHLHVALMDGSIQKVTVTDFVFFDKEGERARG